MHYFFRIALITISLLISFSFAAQSNLTAEETANYIERFNKAEGTYQIQILGSRARPSLEISIIDQIENARKEEEIVYIEIMNNVRIMVLPYSTIKSISFKPVDKIAFINPSGNSK